MKLIELIIDENMEMSGIDAVSIVENPAIEANFVALNQQMEYNLAKVDDDKRLIMGALLIPNKEIYRRDDKNGEYNIYFSKDTIRQCMELYFKNGNQNNATFEHNQEINGLTMIESWIVEDLENDKSKLYNLNVPIGTWCGTMKVNNEVIWNDFIKTGKVKGFSIEGYFADKAKLNATDPDEEEFNEIKDFLTAYFLESYTDYPQQASDNAQIALDYADKNGWGSCGTAVGKARANQLANREPISEDTISRMASFARQKQNSNRPLGEGCGRLMWQAWGGDAGVDWASKKLKSIRKDLATNMPHYTADGKLYTGETHISNGKLMTGAEHSETSELLYHNYQLAKIGERGGVAKSDKAPNSDTKNTDPKGKGTAKGDASNSRGAVVPKAVEESLQKKADDFNERYKDKLGYGVTIGQLKTVYVRGFGAFGSSHSPLVKSPQQWASARVNAYLYLVKNGRPENPKYVSDNDLLPAKHPKK